MPEQQQTRERTPANLSTKYDPKLGETNAKRFQAGVTALLKTSDHKGEQLFALLFHNSTDDGKKVFEHLEHDVAQAWDEIITHAPEVPRSTLQSLQRA